MKSRLWRIEIENFKAFRRFTLDLEGRHLLVFGANGSGKSSLYWALFTFLQSSRKTTSELSKYFTAGHPEQLLNLHELREPAPCPGKIELTLSDGTTAGNQTRRVSATDHDTANDPLSEKADRASDFITYRFFFGFSHFRNSEDFNLWSLFEHEILPFSLTTGTSAGELHGKWKSFCQSDPNPNAFRGTAGAKAYRDFNFGLRQYCQQIQAHLDDINQEAARFYEAYFASDDPLAVSFELKIVADAFRRVGDPEITPPDLRLLIAIGGVNISRPQSHLNEAKMTQLALSIRLAASRVSLHDSDFRLLVIDDLLVSLDMSNRMKVVDILLSSDFEDYQKIILTHDKGFFQETRRMIGVNHSEWCYLKFHADAEAGVKFLADKSGVEKAADYLQGHDLEAAASQLRKAVEDTAKHYRSVAMGEISPPGEFHSLTEDLRAAKNHLLEALPLHLYKKAFEAIPINHREKLVSVTDEDIDADGTLSPEDKGRIKTQRKRLKQLFSNQAWKNLETIELIERVLRMKDRVLNPAAHWNETPLYDAEVKKAMNLIERLEKTLLP